MTHGEPSVPPGPPALACCEECGRLNGAIAMLGHLPGCATGEERRRRSAVLSDVRAAIAQAISERRNDTEFMDRLHARIEADGVILDRLVDR